VANDYTFRFDSKLYQIPRADIRAGLRGGRVRVEQRMDRTLAVRFRDRYLTATECAPRPKAPPAKPTQLKQRKTTRRKSDWMKNFHVGKNDQTHSKTSVR
jgi:hypothetical protein